MTHWQKTYPAWISFAAIAFLLAVWEIICSTGLISSLFLPAPSAILTALGKLITSGEISRSLTASLYRILLGFALGSIIGLLVGLVTGTSALMDRIGTPIVNALYPIPKIALLPLFILWLGIGELSKVTIIALGVFFPVAMNTYSGVKNVDTLLIKVAVSFNASWRLTMKSVVLPSALPVIFAGLPEIFESEGYDRTSMKLPKCQDRLIEEVLKVQPNVVVVLHNGSPVELPWADRVSAILEMYLGGQGVGEACDRLLFGEANPSGRLAETFPYRLEDNPSFLHFPGNGKRVLYGEDIFVGYRYYDTKKVPVRYAFGHGLSYTEFTYGDLTLSSAQMTGEDILTVSLKVKNSGKTEGKEVVQLYVADLCGISERPVKELKGFAKVHLLPGEEKTVSMEISARNLSYYEERLGDWYAPSGTYRILIGHASDDIRLHADVVFEIKKKLPLRVDFTTTFGELLDHTKTAPVITELLAPLAAAAASAEGMSDEYKKLGEQVIREMPLKSLLGQMPGEQVEQLIGQLNCLLAQ